MQDCFQFYYPERTVPLHSLLLNCGHDTVDSREYYWDGLKRGSHPMAVWQYTVSGCGALEVNGEIHELPPGKAFFVVIPSAHVYFLPPNSKRWEFYFLSFTGTEALRLATEFQAKYGNALSHPAKSLPVEMVLDLFDDCRRGKLPDKFQSSELCYRFLMLLYDEFEKHAGPEVKKRLLDPVIRYFLDHPSDNQDITELAEKFGYSRSHFTRLFHREAGMPPREFLNDLRLRIAVRLLETEPFSIKEIASHAGFSEPSYFCRVFRKKYKTSPEAFRNTVK